MQQTIWKYQLNPETILEIPQDGQILAIQVQNSAPYMWVLVNPQAPKVSRKFIAYGTGHLFESQGTIYRGTFQLPEDGLVFHVFEYREEQS